MQGIKVHFLGIKIQQHPLFEPNSEFLLINDQRINKENTDQLTNLDKGLWINNLVAITGKNATGKTSLMKLLNGIQNLLFFKTQISQTSLNDVLFGEKPIIISAFIYGEDKILYQDQLTFNMLDGKLAVTAEEIKAHKLTERMSKKRMLDFSKAKIITSRKNISGLVESLLSNEDSIFRVIIAEKNYRPQPTMSSLFFTNFNFLQFFEEKIPSELLTFLDSSIEYLKQDIIETDGKKRKVIFRLKFKNSPEIVEDNFNVIAHYFSSGTAKGITLYGMVIKTLQTGGILYIDELENHFNHTIVRSFIEYFANPKLNRNRAVLVFSTHYSELIDDLDRGDAIYITRRDKNINLMRYSQADVRPDLLRSEVIDSNSIDGTMPEYSLYLALRKEIQRIVGAYGN